MNRLQGVFYKFVKDQIETFWSKWELFVSKPIEVKDITEKKFEVINFPDKIEVHGKVQTDYEKPEDKFDAYRGLISGLQDDIVRKIDEYRVIAPILESIRDKDNKPVVNLSNDFSEIVTSLSKIDEKMAKLYEKPAEFEKLKGVDPNDYVPVRLTDGKSFYKAMSILGDSSDPLAGYKISDVDDGNDDYNYYGYLKYTGKWYIMCEDVVNKTYRYVSGTSNYADNFASKSSLDYKYFNQISL